MSATEVTRVSTGDWPEAISDGLTLPCHDCGQHQVVDYTISDEAWARAVPELDARRSVVCLSCLIVRAGKGILKHIERVQIIGVGETLVLRPDHRYIYAT